VITLSGFRNFDLFDPLWQKLFALQMIVPWKTFFPFFNITFSALFNLIQFTLFKQSYKIFFSLKDLISFKFPNGELHQYWAHVNFNGL